MAEFNFADGKLEGLSKAYYENGVLKHEAYYKGSKKNGIQKRYYEDGKLKKTANFKDNKLDGIVKAYYKSGNLWMEIAEKDGKLLFACYDEQGNKRKCTEDEIELNNEYSTVQ
jgi:antitoxin component YwqK of YwqJK toxin-antitoxin module